MIININTKPQYKVLLQSGCIGNGSIKAFFSEYQGMKAAIITDNNVAKLYLKNIQDGLKQAGVDNSFFIFNAGEQSKSLSTVEQIYNFLSNNNITRADIIIALGGGVVGDIAGFVAATYLRGIKYIQVPTTLLAMVDSSIGGKTAINLTAGKNLVGSFYQPSKVIIDTLVLQSLGFTEWQNGIGEMIKYGAIADKQLFNMLGELDIKENIEKFVDKCIRIKKSIVEKDMLDLGERQILNFGHTLGHAIEKHSHFTMSHGKAVGVGMVLISQWAESICLTRSGTALKIKQLLDKYGMPTHYQADLSTLWEYATNDKKAKGHTITLAIIENIGEGRLLDIKKDKFLSESVNVQITPSKLKGKIIVPPSKSMAHRAIFCAILSTVECIIENIELSQDIIATINVAKRLGKQVCYDNGNLTISGQITNKDITIDCNESGTTFRFLLAVLSALGVKANITGKERLGQRPYSMLVNQLISKGVEIDSQSGLPINIKGQLQGGDFYLPGNVSSQFISGLLLALPLLPSDSRIILTQPLQSSAYVDMTLSCMDSFGVIIEKRAESFYVKGNQSYKCKQYCVEGDFSNAAFWACGAALTGKVDILGLNKNSIQGDRQIITILKEMGAEIKELPKGYRIESASLKGVEVDAENIPDLVPILSIIMAFAEGKSIIKNTQRLQLKECDRQKAVVETLLKMGVETVIKDNHIIIVGTTRLKNGVFESYNDHRMAMSLAIAATASGEISIKGAQAVAKSYPNFYLDYKKLGGKYVINLGG